MAFALSTLFEAVLLSFKTGERIDCYHCGEKMSKANALTTRFNGVQQPVCCHGCLAILRTVEQNKLVEAYLKSRGSLTVAG